MGETRLWQAGAECNGVDSADVEFDVINDVAFVASSNRKKTGTYSFEVPQNNGLCWAQANIPGTYQARIGMHAYGYEGISAYTYRVVAFVAWRSTSGTLGSLRLDEDGDMHLYIGGVSKDEAVGAFPSIEWAHFGINIKIDGSAGWVSVYKDGVKIMTFTGDTGSEEIESVRFGSSEGDGYWFTEYSYYDDLLIDDITDESDAPVPDRRFPYVTANADGDHTDWDRNTGASDYEAVDEQPHDGDTTYLASQAAEEKSTVNLTTYSIPEGWAVNAVIPCATIKKTNAGVATKTALMTRYSSSEEEGSEQDLPTSYGLVSDRFTAKPGGGGWDQASIDGLQVGVWSEGTF